jgi:hypothetical protein
MLFPYFSNFAQYFRVVDGLVPPTACPVPYLEDFAGPHKLLPITLGQAMGDPLAHLRRVFLESVDDYAGDPLDSVMNSFQSCHPLQLRALTHIHMSLLKSMDLKSLAELQDMFPVLQVLHFEVSEYDDYSSGLSCQFSEIPCPFDATLPLLLG